ncbi:MAG: polyisoprenoid-binding protein [Gammaproteobacteria bacterium]|nr:polyisoprenoid-binding protein [Gammaproteobacteria bacterium]
MRINFLFPIFFVTTLFSSTAFSASYTIDPEHTYPSFEISHLGFSTMRGLFEKTSGKLTMDLSKKTGSVDIVIDAASINTAHAKRDKHLRSPDFLNTVEYPEIKYKSTKVEFTSDTTINVSGDLTLAGVTKPVVLNVTHIKCGTHPFNKKELCGFDAQAKIMRSDFGLKYGLPGIGDEMKLLFEVEAFKD